jgi:hypothetical protein
MEERFEGVIETNRNVYTRNLWVRFESPREGRVSQEMGPFPLVNHQWEEMYVMGEGGALELLAFLDDGGDWVCRRDELSQWSDVIIFSKEVRSEKTP